MSMMDHLVGEYSSGLVQAIFRVRFILTLGFVIKQRLIVSYKGVHVLETGGVRVKKGHD